MLTGCDAAALLDVLRRERRAVVVRVAGEERWIAADDAGLYRDALGVVPPGGLPEAFVAEVQRRAREARGPLRAHARPVHDGRAARALRRRSGRARSPRWRRAATSCAASCVPAAASASGATPTCCAASAARRSPCCARRSRPSTSARWRRSCRAGRASTAIPPPAPGSTACARRSSRSRGSRCPRRSGSATCCRAASGAYSPAWLDQLTASGEVVWVGAGAIGRDSGRVALYFRDDAPAIGPPHVKGPAPSRRPQPVHDDAARAPARVAVLLHRPARRAAGPRARGDPGRRCGTSCGPAR